MKKVLLIISLLFIGYFSSFSQEVNKTIKVQKSLLNTQFIYGNEILSNYKLIKILESNEFAYDKIASGFTFFSLSKVLGTTGFLMLGWQLTNELRERQVSQLRVLTGTGLVLISIPFSLAYNKKAKNAVKIYNKAQLNTSFWDNKELKLTINGNGAGLILVF